MILIENWQLWALIAIFGIYQLMLPMFSKIVTAIKGFFSNLFSGKSATQDDNTVLDPQDDIAQDGSEMLPNSAVVMVNEMEKVVILPNEPDKEFDEDIFEEEAEAGPKQKAASAEKLKGRFLWCLDNGHGKKTNGKRSPKFDDGITQLLEYEFNRDVIKRIAEKLKSKGVPHYVVVPEVDVDDFLKERVERANKKWSNLPKIFVSVHANAAPARSSNDWAPDTISGIETWFYHGSKKGQKVASIFQKHLIKKTGYKNRHLKSRPDNQFYVLRKTKMTSILTENGFYNNKKECADLMKSEVRQKIADAHVNAILEIEKNGI